MTAPTTSISGEPYTKRSVPAVAALPGWLQTELGNIQRGQALTLPGDGRTVVALSAYLFNNRTFNVLDYGAKGDGVTDDTAAIHKTYLAALRVKGTVRFPATAANEYKITTAIPITGPVRTTADGRRGAALVCAGCNGFEVSAGVLFHEIAWLRIVSQVRWTPITPNSLTAIKINGTTALQCYWHTYEHVFIDGFEVGLRANGVCQMLVHGVDVEYCKHGLIAEGQTLNNIVSDSFFVGSHVDDGHGAKIGDGVIDAEGWTFANTLLFGFARGVWGYAAININVLGCVIDYFREFGVVVQSSATAPATNCIVADTYMAATGTASVGVFLVNNYAPSTAQHHGTVVHGNEILYYADGSSLDYGVLIDGSEEVHDVIDANRIKATVADCRIAAGTNHSVTGNHWLGAGYSAAVRAYYSGNVGPCLVAGALLVADVAGRLVTSGSAAPSAWTWGRGDLCWNETAALGAPVGWMCTAAGTPGTWAPMATL